MSDYATNGVAHGKSGHIRKYFERRFEADGKVATDVLAAFLAGGKPAGSECFRPDVYDTGAGLATRQVQGANNLSTCGSPPGLTDVQANIARRRLAYPL
jgi:hypothetical protein